jgi:hypothetical protein
MEAFGVCKMFTYQSFGLKISSDLHFPELLKQVFPFEQADIKIQAGVVAFNSHKERAGYNFYGTPQSLILRISDIADFKIINGNTITYQSHTDIIQQDELRLFILGSCMGALLQQRGLVVLHGNAISTDGKTAQIFIGDSGAGKSTAAAWHYCQAASILADDVCAIIFNADGKPMAIPSFPQIKLWQSSADLLKIDTKGLRRIRPDNVKYALPIYQQFCTQPLLVTQIIEVNKANIPLKIIEGIEKISLLIKHSYRYQFLDVMQLKQAYMKNLIQLAPQVKMRKEPRLAISPAN